MDVDRDGSMHQERPACLKSPISSFFCVSTLIIGCPAAVKVAICSSIVGELDIAVGVTRASFELFAVDAQRIVQLAQQPANGGWTQRMASLFQAIAQRPQAAAHPLLGAHRVANARDLEQQAIGTVA